MMKSLNEKESILKSIEEQDSFNRRTFAPKIESSCDLQYLEDLLSS